MIGDPQRPMLVLGLPPDAIAWIALLVGLTLLGGGKLTRRLHLTSPHWLWPLAATAAALSAAYFHFLLGGIPRIIDATAYLLEARTFATGHWTFEVPEPTALFRGRFLLHAAEYPRRLGVIFPPGYPALLSLGVRAGCYQLVGPLLAACLVGATFWLARVMSCSRTAALGAAAFSVVCGALRYHTADTMSHGWSTLLTTLALTLTCWLLASAAGGRARQSASATRQASSGWRTGTDARTWAAGALGLSLGLLLATRQLTALVMIAACGWGLWTSGPRLKELAWTGVGLLPGLLLLAGYHDALTGNPWQSPQLAYYHLADGPPGCFGLGLGKGCHFEHADVVAQQGGEGLTLGWAALNTVHRLHWFSLDVANLEPLALLVLPWLWARRRRPEGQVLAVAFVGLPLSYAFFYFAGSYPGGGARFLSELLPLCHVAIAGWLARRRLLGPGLGLALIGYGLHGSYSHHLLAEGVDVALAREITEASRSLAPADLSDASAPPDKPTSGSVGSNDRSRSTSSAPRVARLDHRFNLLFDPTDPSATVRWTGDDRLALLMGERPTLPWRFELEHDWPPEALDGLWVFPSHFAADCVSGGRALSVRPVAPNSWLSLEATGVPRGRYEVRLWYWSSDTGCRQRDLGVYALPARIRVRVPPGRNPGTLAFDRLELIPEAAVRQQKD